MLTFLWRLFPLSIHCWGGLGSQLYALNLAFRISDKFPLRTLRIVFHTSGVTRRPLELNESAIPFSHKVIDDFRFKDTPKMKSSGRSAFIGFSKLFLTKLGLLAQADCEQQLENLSRWVIHIRGHYSYLDVAPKELSQIGQTIGIFQNLELAPSICRIHLRLGDLLTLAEKQPINPISLQQVIMQISANSSNTKFQVYSDSDKQDVDKYFADMIHQPNYTVLSADTKTVIRQCVVSEFFIGSNSKISNWICAFRMQIGLHSFIPVSRNYQYSSPLTQTTITFYK